MRSPPGRNWFAESDIREAREDRKRHGRTYKQARELYALAAKSASICGECFRPLAPTDSVTMEWRKISKHAWVRVPVCLSCHLDALAENERRPFSLERHYWRGRCRNCDRPIRIALDWYGTPSPPSLNAQTCCTTCARLAKNKRNAERRRVEHAPIRCANPACGKLFTPKRDDATTCSNKCRQALHRERKRAERGRVKQSLRKPIEDAQGRKWFMRYKQYRDGWQWNARHGNHGQSSGSQLFRTKALAAEDARRSIQSHDAIASTAEFFRRVAKRGSECALTPEDHEAIRRAAAFGGGVKHPLRPPPSKPRHGNRRAPR
jgi:hypothetical protein